jgi:hypothetical protein
MLLSILCSSKTTFAQTTTVAKPITLPQKEYKPEILTSGFIDVVNNGQVNASARFIRLYIGEPNKFAIPLSIYSGVSANNFSNVNNTSISNRSNVHLVNNFINPMSGLINVSFENLVYFKKNYTGYTKYGSTYQIGSRVLTGYKQGLINNPTTGNPINFFNQFASVGLYFQTGAWERDNAKNVGVFWLSTRYIICSSSSDNLKEIIPAIETNGLYHGYSIAWGVDINKLINLKVVWYKYIKKPEIDFNLAIYQFSFNYSLK